MRQRRRKYYSPSTGRKLVLLVTSPEGKRKYSGALLNERVDSKRDKVIQLAGTDHADWAVARLKETPESVNPGWPAPCKAARIQMPTGKAVRA